MQIQRLSWAGLKIVTDEVTLTVDPLENVEGVRAVGLGEAREPIVPVAGEVDAALITHLHPDHFDPAVLRRVLRDGGPVFCPSGILGAVKRAGLPACPVNAGDRVRIGDATVDAVLAVDGFGEHQVSWIVEVGRRRIFHGGDTLWHGDWWRIARRYSPIDLVFLPINGPLLEPPGVIPSGTPAAMTPEQAVAAAAILDAGAICPIHYGMFHNPPLYTEHPDPLSGLKAAAERRGIRVLGVPAGGIVPLPASVAAETEAR